jgi:hypothetical protein
VTQPGILIKPMRSKENIYASHIHQSQRLSRKGNFTMTTVNLHAVYYKNNVENTVYVLEMK